MTRLLGLLVVLVGLAAGAGIAVTDAGAQDRTVTIRAARVLDGKGGAWTNATIEVTGNTITRVDQRSGPVTYDLGDVTLRSSRQKASAKAAPGR